MLTLDILKKRLTNHGTLIVQNERGYSGIAEFMFTEGVSEDRLKDIELQLQMKLPNGYKNFLKFSNGATLFYDQAYGQWGCRLLSAEELLTATIDWRNNGLNIPDNYLVFCHWFGDLDLLLFDIEKENSFATNYIVYADSDYPSEEWVYIQGDFEVWLDRLVVAQGAKYWQWC